MANNLVLVWLLGAVLLSGCASNRTPKEVVELSYVMGEDISTLHESFRKLIREKFEDYRKQRLEYLEKEWKPAYLKDFSERGRLADIGAGTIVWSKAERKFVTPDQGQEGTQRLQSVQVWATAAVAALEKKKQGLIAPIDADEAAILTSVDSAFSRLYRANAAITAHLNSTRKVDEIQDKALEALNIRTLRDTLDKALIESSRKAAAGLEEVKRADEKVAKISEVIQSP